MSQIFTKCNLQFKCLRKHKCLPKTCGACDKSFTRVDTRRRHERACRNWLVPQHMRTRDIEPEQSLMECITDQHQRIQNQIDESYDTMAMKMMHTFGEDVYEQKKYILMIDSLKYMMRSTISEQFNMISCVKSVMD